MKKRIIRISIFFGVLLGLVLLINWRLGVNIDNSEKWMYKEIFEPKIKANAIILGSSRAAQGIDPGHLDSEEYTFYNFAFIGGNPSFYQKWYQHVFKEHYPKPDLILFEIDWTAYELMYTRRKLEHDSQYLPAQHFRQLLLNTEGIDKKSLVYNRIPFLKYREEVEHVFFKKSDFSPFNMAAFDRGYLPYTLESTVLKKVEQVNLHNDYGEVAVFLELMEMFKTEGIEVAWVQTPEYLPGRECDDFEERQKWMCKAARDQGITFWDFAGEKGPDWQEEAAYFGDWKHLNEKGSQVFSEMLGDSLRKIQNSNR